MFVELTENIAPDKGFVKGARLDYPRPTLAAISKQLGRSDWYKPVSFGRSAEHGIVLPMRPKKTVPHAAKTQQNKKEVKNG